jgi:hypothetical protein
MGRVAALLVFVLLGVAGCDRSDNGGGSSTSSAAIGSASTSTSSAAVDRGSATAAAASSVVLDQGGGGVDYIGHLVRVVVPPDGLPFIVYLSHDGAEEGSEDWMLLAVKCAEPSCEGEHTAVSFDLRNWGQAPSLAIGPDGLPAFVYYDQSTFEEDEAQRALDPDQPPDSRLHLVRCLDPGCVEHTDTDLGPGQSASVAIPGDDLPVVVYNELTKNETAVLKCGDPACESSTVTLLDGLRFAFDTPVGIGQDGYPVLAIARSERLGEETEGDIPRGQIAVVYCTDATCSDTSTPVVVAETDERPDMIDLAMESGRPVLAVAVEAQRALVRCLDTECSESGPLSRIGPPQQAEASVMAMGADALPVFAYGAEGEDGQFLAVAKCADASCSEGTIAVLDENWIFDLDMTISPDGNPVLAYYAPPELRVVTCADPACLDGAIDVAQWDQESSLVESEPIGEIMAGWRVLPNADRVFGPGGGGGLSQVVAGEAGLIAVGTACEIEDGQTGQCFGGVWASTDGEEWQLAADLGTADIRQVIRAGPGFVAVGTTCVEGPEGPPAGDCAPAIWTSEDGTEWTRIGHDEELFPSCAQIDEEFCFLSLDGIVKLPSGALLVTGGSAEGAGTWTSSDGLIWIRSDEPLQPFGADRDGYWWVDGVVAGGPGLVATGAQCREQMVAFLGVRTSNNKDGTGVTIDDVFPDTAADASGLEINDVIKNIHGEDVADVDTFSLMIRSLDPDQIVQLSLVRDGTEMNVDVALGETEEYPCSALMAISPDGTTWTQIENVIPAEGDSFFGQLVAWDQRLVSIGEACDLAYECEPVLLTSTDAVTWTSTPLGDMFQGINIFRLFAFESGLLGIGATFDEVTHSEQSAFVFSADGDNWTVYAADPAVFPENIGINDLIEIESRYIGVGSGRGGPTIYIYEAAE